MAEAIVEAGWLCAECRRAANTKRRKGKVVKPRRVAFGARGFAAPPPPAAGAAQDGAVQ